MSDAAKRELSDEQIDAACLAAWKAAGFIGRPVASNEWYRVTYLAGYRAAPAADAVKREGLSDELAAISNALAHSPFRRHQSMALTVARAAAALAAPASVRAGSTIIMDGSTEGSVELRELQGAVQESLPAATARGNSSPAGVESGPSTLSPASAQTPAGEALKYGEWKDRP